MYVVEVTGAGVEPVRRAFPSRRSALRVAGGYKRVLPRATIKLLSDDGNTIQAWIDGHFQAKGGFSRLGSDAR